MEPVAMKKDKVLLVEDDYFFSKTVKCFLERVDRFEVHLAADGQSAWELFKQEQFDICLLDVVMPKMDGFSLSVLIREVNQDVPIIFISSRYLESDRIMGFKQGGDDYLVKPFSFEELRLRMNIFLKRSKGQQFDISTTYKFRDYTLDMKWFTITQGEHIETIFPKEARLLQLLAENKNKLISREDILVTVWGAADFFSGRSLDVYISRLRKRFSKDKHVLIEAKRNKGYILQIVDGI